MKKTILGIVASTAIVAPLAMTISCQSNGDTRPGQLVTDALDDEFYSKEAFNVNTLQQRAIEEGDTSYWNGGLPYHAISESFSILRGLAREYGYETEKDNDGKTAQERFLNGGKIIFDGDAINLSDSKQIQILKSIVVRQTPPDITPWGDRQLLTTNVFGDDGAFTIENFTTLNNYNLDLQLQHGISFPSNIFKDDTGKEIEINYPSYSLFNDPTVPGQIIMHIETSEKAQDSGETKNFEREIKIPGLSQIYSDINPALFKSRILPIAKTSIEQTIKLAVSPYFQMALALANVKEKQMFDEIEFLKNKFFKDSDDGLVSNGEMDSPNFENKLRNMNNGSAHWLALEVFSKGLNYSFTSDVPQSKDNPSESVKPNDIYKYVAQYDRTDKNAPKPKAGYWQPGFNLPGLNDFSQDESLILERAQWWFHYSDCLPGDYVRLAPNPFIGFDAQALSKIDAYNMRKS